jgi:5-bromo-4-chloroindolyl phosphate hydrolysis protein
VINKILKRMYDDSDNLLAELNNPEHINADYRDMIEDRVENIRFELRAIKREMR